MTKFKVITFTSGNWGYFFYSGENDADYGRIIGMKELTLPAAIAYLKKKEINPVEKKEIKISVYYF